MKQNQIYEEVTRRIIEQLEKGEIPWKKPWKGTNGAYSRATGKPYGIVCQLIMPPGEYATFKRISDEGGKVHKGAKGYPVIFWKTYRKEIENKDGEVEVVSVPVLRAYTVFNIESQTNLECKWQFSEDKEIESINKLEEIKDGYIERSGVTFAQELSGSAYYSPRKDKVMIPLKSQFSNQAEYYGTVFHELAHSTGHKSRLNRGLETDMSFGNENYSREELIAELTSCSILANTGIETESSFRNSSAYIQSWVKALRNDVKMIIWAGSRVEKAMDMIVR